MERALRLTTLLLLGALLAGAELHLWVDDRGLTHVTDDPGSIPDGRRAARADAVEDLRVLWQDGLSGPPLHTPAGASSRDEDRTLRTLRDAVDDLRRGETSRATAALREVLRREPTRPEAHWYMALLSGRRGRLDAAEGHLRSFLSAAGEEFEPWRASAIRRLEQVEDERRLMASPAAAGLRLVDLEHGAFRIQADAALVAAGSADFARSVARYLDDARAVVGGFLGADPAEPTGVVLYGKPAYLKTHGHRFSFQTVGFFDGRIHVVSAAHPAGELRTLLLHEYTHAVFNDRTGGDRPMWLNEGLAELAERLADGRDLLTSGERSQLRRALERGRWIPLGRLGPGFAGLGDGDARLAYLEARFAALWLTERTASGERARLLELLGEGLAADAALRQTLGLDTAGLDAALRREFEGS